MRVELKDERFLITLPTRLFNDLKEYDKLHEKMDLELSVLIIYFILKKQSEPQERVPLYSLILRKYNYGKVKAKDQIELLKKGGFIEYLNHQNNIRGKKNASRRFTISEKYFKQKKISSPESIHTYALQQPCLLKKVEKHNKQRRIDADSSTQHITKWLKSNGFTIQNMAAWEHNKEKYIMFPGKYWKRHNIITCFDPSQSYSRDGKDDRLHSIFTQIPRDMKKYIRFQGQRLVEVDIKSSQPMMFAILLEKIIKHYYELQRSSNGVTETRLIKRILNTLKKFINNEARDYYNVNKYVIDIYKISYSITIILLKAFKAPDFAAIEDFISLVKNGTIYEELGEYLLSKRVIWKEGDKYYTRLYNKITEKQEDSPEDTLRDAAKKILLNALYSPKGKGSIKVINKVKDYFSTIFQIADAFKVTFYEDFSLILQRMEAKCVLDHCAKNIDKKFPDMPLICRHDSLSTTEKFGDSLFEEFQKQINCYFDTTIKLKKEVW